MEAPLFRSRTTPESGRSHRRGRRSLPRVALAGLLVAAGGLSLAPTPVLAAAPAARAVTSPDATACATPPAQRRVSEAQTALSTAAAAAAAADAAVPRASAALEVATTAATAASARASAASTARASASARVDVAHAALVRAQRTLDSAVARRAAADTVRKLRASRDAAQATYTSRLKTFSAAASASAQAASQLSAARTALAAASAAYSSASSVQANGARAVTAATAALASARTAQASAPVVVVTQNLDFATGAPRDRPVLAHLCAQGADFVMVQEAKNLRLASLIPAQMATNQDTRDAGRAGSALLWRRPSALDAKGRLGAVTTRPLALGVNAQSFRVQMLDRYISYVDTTIGGRPARMISVHYPPARFKKAWPAMHSSLRRVIAARPAGAAWVVGGDMNQRPSAVARVVGGTAYGSGIDGFVLSSNLRGQQLTALPYARSIGASDHHGVRLEIVRR